MWIDEFGKLRQAKCRGEESQRRGQAVLGSNGFLIGENLSIKKCTKTGLLSYAPGGLTIEDNQRVVQDVNNGYGPQRYSLKVG